MQVTWVENAEVEDKTVHQIFDQFVESGMAFGAHRWLAVLQRQCERLASLMARNISDLGGAYLFLFLVTETIYKAEFVNFQSKKFRPRAGWMHP